MKYNKPEVKVLESAIDAVQSANKLATNVLEGQSMTIYAFTHNAYEADE